MGASCQLLLLLSDVIFLLQALLQMVCDESHQILALSESRDPPSALSRGEPRDPLHHLPSDKQGLLEVAPDTGEKVQS